MRTKESNPVDAPKIDNPEKDINDDYEAKDHLRVLMDAHSITTNPEKMKKVHKLAGRHTKALEGIRALAPIEEPKVPKSTSDLKDIYQNKFGKTKAPKLGVPKG